jgi:glycosyltransferase involved in cell wall biosynthesis
VIPYLKGLTKSGYRFTILSCEKPEMFAAHKSAVDLLLEGSGIEWVYIKYHKRPQILSTFYDYLHMKQKAFVLQRQYHFDMVHTRPGVPTLVALQLQKKFKLKFLNDIRGFWAQERIDGGMWNVKNPVYAFIFKYFRKQEQVCLQKADAVVCLTEKARVIIEQEALHLGKSVHPVVIPCSADTELFNPQNVSTQVLQTLRSSLNLQPQYKVISYLGSVGGWYMTDEMISFCKKVFLLNPQVYFLFITPHKHDVIRNLATQYGIPETHIRIVSATRNQVPAYLALSDFNLFFIKPAYSKLASSPTKHGEVMAMGIPVITNNGVGDVAEIVRKYYAGFIVKAFTEQAYIETAEKVFDNTETNKSAIRKGALEVFSLENAVEAYRRVYERTLKT